ncbi:MAG: phosphatidate cytidylyltransferase, partial [Clostridia bacterium]|nr:phosphatidate cytidylyltransferase [Clostridia bacterium]
ILVFLLTWANDTGAFFIGSKFGKHRLSPKLSPKKSIEGFVGGLVFTVVTALVFGYLVYGSGYLMWVLLGCLVAVIGTMGDLLESAFKRLAQAKDSGNLIPGHGGLLDRLDSLLLVAPTVYYFVQWFNL